MQLKEGAIVEGKVTGITKYGAFIKIGNDMDGMIHISEISLEFVKNIDEHLKLEQIVKAVVVGINENGKVSLSIKKLQQLEGKTDAPNREMRDRHTSASNHTVKSPEEYAKPDRTPKGGGSFEDMMSKFKQDSDEKMSGLKNFEPKKNTFARKKNYSNNQSDKDD